MDQRIIKFIKRHHVMTLTSVADARPWSCQVFYAYDELTNSLLFTSGADTQHIVQAMQNANVAVSIVLESRVVARLQGAQIEGLFASAQEDRLRSIYIKRFPFVALTLGTLWQVKITTAKYTDNTLGFGTKLYFPQP